MFQTTNQTMVVRCCKLLEDVESPDTPQLLHIFKPTGTEIRPFSVGETNGDIMNSMHWVNVHGFCMHAM